MRNLALASALMLAATISVQAANAQAFNPTACKQATSTLVTKNHTVSCVVHCPNDGDFGGVEFTGFPSHLSSFSVDVSGRFREGNSLQFVGISLCPASHGEPSSESGPEHGHVKWFNFGDDAENRGISLPNGSLRYIWNAKNETDDAYRDCAIEKMFCVFEGAGETVSLSNFMLDGHPAHPIFTHTTNDVCVMGPF
jgi:hypothetical protein